MEMINKFDKIIKQKQNKILCLGIISHNEQAKNYFKHVVEMGGKDFPEFPVVFEKPWSTIVYEPNPIKFIKNSKNIIDHESMLPINTL